MLCLRKFMLMVWSIHRDIRDGTDSCLCVGFMTLFTRDIPLREIPESYIVDLGVAEN
jgi:hypothetical protein